MTTLRRSMRSDIAPSLRTTALLTEPLGCSPAGAMASGRGARSLILGRSDARPLK